MFDGQFFFFFFDQPVRKILTTYGSIKKLQQVKEMIIQLVACWSIIISKTIIRTAIDLS